MTNIAIYSGGMDSTTLVYDMSAQWGDLHLLSFNYGQRHKRELEYAARMSDKLGFRHDIIDLSAINGLISPSGSVLVDLDREVPEGHYADDNMAQTVVPNRNMIMLSIAIGTAVADRAEVVGFGAHLGDRTQYPDCRIEFVTAINDVAHVANEGFIDPGFELYVPFIDSTKADIAVMAIEMEVPFHETWSCYKGGEIHCGRCATCIERLEAIDEACKRLGLDPEDVDQTLYGDKDYWRKAVKEFAER